MSFAVTYTTLQQMMKDWPVNQGDNYVADLPQIIGMGELRLIVDLNLDIFDLTDATQTIAVAERFIDKPVGLVQLRALRLALVTSTSFTAASANSLALSFTAPIAPTIRTLTGALGPAPATLTPARQVTVSQVAGLSGVVVTIKGLDAMGTLAVEVLDTVSAQLVMGTTRFSQITSISVQGGAVAQDQVLTLGTAAVTTTVLGESYPVVKRSKDFCDAYNSDPAVVGRPKYFNEYSFSQWEVVQSADQTYGVVLHYIQRPESIIDSGTTWLGTYCGELLFLASLMEAERYLKADDRFDDMHQDYQEKLGTRRMELRESIRSGDPSPMKPAATKAQ